METLEQIAEKVGRETDEYLSDKIAAPEEWKRIRDIEFSNRLVEELAKQEPVGVVTWLNGICCFEPTEGNDYPTEFTELYAAPSLTPEDVRDAERWNLVPAFAEKYQIDLVGLFDDIDVAMTAAQEEK